jgi:Ferritin-like domain
VADEDRDRRRRRVRSRSRSSTSTARRATRRSSPRRPLALENTGVHAYLGQAGNLQTPKYLLAAASIVTIEARHAGVIGLSLGKAIAPSGPFDGLPASAILKAVKKTKFIVG